MKKTIIIALATAGFAMGALAQGSITGVNADNQYVTTGVGNYNTSIAASTSYYAGGLTMEVFFASGNQASAANAINALNGTAGGGAAALALLGTDGFTQVGLTGGYPPNSGVGAISGTAASPNTSQLNGFLTTQNLVGPGNGGFASSTVGYLALYFTGTGGFSTYSSAIVISGNYGGNSAAPAPAFAVTTALNAFASANAQNGNIDLTAPTGVPEPSSLALAGLGGFGMLMAFRRKKA
jgi:hypothetical protein